MDIQTVAVIGGGPSGIVITKLLLAEKYFSEVRMYEQRDALAGIWNYDDPMFPSSVYVGLESNIPSTIMEFSDKKFPSRTPLLPSRQALRDYIQEYGKEIEDFGTLRHRVITVEPTNDQSTTKWCLEVEDIRNGTIFQRVFDAVVVASGRYDKPNIPGIPGLDVWQANFPGSILHSSTFQDASLYQDRKVLIVGYSSSGTDIAEQLLTISAKPLLVSRSTDAIPLAEHDRDPSRILLLPKIVEFLVDDRAIRCADGSIHREIDTVILCTGYQYDYPFLRNIPSFQRAGNQDTYEHIFWTKAPSLAFVLLPLRVTAFPFSEVQAAYISRVWSGRLDLPSLAVMESWVSKRKETCKTSKDFHKLGYPAEVEYINSILDQCSRAKPRHGLPDRGQGYLPPHWGPDKRWLRQVQHDIRNAVAAMGAERHFIYSMEQVGFHYPSDRTPSSTWNTVWDMIMSMISISFMKK